MDITYVSALSALAGSVIGGLTTGSMSLASGAATGISIQAAGCWTGAPTPWTSARWPTVPMTPCRWKNYASCLEEARADLVGLYAMISRMRVLSTSRIVVAADKIMRVIVDTYSAQNKSALEVRELIKEGTEIDVLKEFSEAAREEMHLLNAL